MELKLKINSKNTFPKQGIFIKSALPKVWLQEIQAIGLDLNSLKVFPVPGINPSELFGCLLVLNQSWTKIGDIGKNNFLQLIENKLFIPENTIVTPQLTKEEWHKLFSENYHLFHPEIGLVELKEEVSWIDILETPTLKDIEILQPAKTVYVPQFISSFRYEIDTEEILQSIEDPFLEGDTVEDLPFDMESIMNGNQEEMDKFLAFFDENPELALKMAIPLDTLGTSRGANDAKFSFGGTGTGTGSGSGFGTGTGTGYGNRTAFGGGKSSSLSNESSSSGSFSVVFKILFVGFVICGVRSCNFNSVNVGSNPLFALFIIIAALAVIVTLALNSSKSSESFESSFRSESSSRSGNSSGAGNSSGSGNAALIDSERFNLLQNRYEKMAQEFIDKKEHSRAAHIYLKLLKNYFKAADVLEKGELYTEAAVVNLKYLNNKHKAAECYEKGHVYNQAIELYTELNQDEKVGDLYTILKNKPEANKYYGKVIDNYKTNYQYVKASLIYKNKIKDTKEAQELLLLGWRNNKDAANCLNNYFENTSIKELPDTITNIYENELEIDNKEKFLELLKHEYNKDKTLEDITRNMAFEIVADRINENPEIASQLISFNKSNKTMAKDIMKFKLKKRNSTKD